MILDGLVRSQKTPCFVIPAEAGIQEYQGHLDPGFHRGDGLEDFYETIILDLTGTEYRVFWPCVSRTKLVRDVVDV